MADGAKGTTISFASSFFSAKLLGISGPGLTRGVTETSHSETDEGWRTFQPSDWKDPGEVEVRIQFNPNTEPPIDEPTETVTITFPVPAGGATGATWACDGFLTAYSPDLDCVGDDAMEATATLKWSGKPTFTAST